MLGNDDLKDELTIRFTIRVKSRELATLDIETGSNDGSKLPPDLHYEAPDMDVPLRVVKDFAKHLLSQRERRHSLRSSIEVMDISDILSSALGKTPAKEEVRN